MASWCRAPSRRHPPGSIRRWGNSGGVVDLLSSLATCCLTSVGAWCCPFWPAPWIVPSISNSRPTWCLSDADDGANVVGYSLLVVRLCYSPLTAWAPWLWDLGIHFAARRCGTHRAWVKCSGPLCRWKQTMFGPCMQIATRCKREVLSSHGPVGLPVLARRWSVESVMFCTLYRLLPFRFYFRCIVLLL